MKLEFSWYIFEKSSNIKFHENPFSGSRVVAWGQTASQTSMTKLAVAFRNFENRPENSSESSAEGQGRTEGELHVI